MKTERNLKSISNALKRGDRINEEDAAASPRVLATEDWYNFEEEKDYNFCDAFDSHASDANAEHKDEAILTKDGDD